VRHLPGPEAGITAKLWLIFFPKADLLECCMGDVRGLYLQVTDTPGLLNRAEEDRNAMERLTLACMAHLPTSVLFVIDLTGQCGTSVAAQWEIRRDLKRAFPAKPW